MWQEAHVHAAWLKKKSAPGTPFILEVNLQARCEMKVADHLMASVIDAILRSPPKWRGMKAGKVRGSIPRDYETPHQVQRERLDVGPREI